MYVCAPRSYPVPMESERVSKSLKLELQNSCEPLRGCWKLIWGPLLAQQMFLTAEPFPQPLIYIFTTYLKMF